jgi:dienelactone hydrolase
MAELILFHHAQGLTPGVQAFADQIRADGHTVAVPDLYTGATFGTLEEGMAHAERMGIENLVDTAAVVAETFPQRVVYGGFSLGALPAHKLAQTRPGALAALLYHHGDVPVTTFGSSWPKGVDVQLHVAEGDEFYERDTVEEFVAGVGEVARAEVYTYPGSAHLFTDSSLPGFDPEATALVVRRTLDFLAGR